MANIKTIVVGGVSYDVEDAVARKAIEDMHLDIPTALSDLTDDATHRLVTDEEKAKWNSSTEVDEDTVAGWGFTKNTGDYSKPEGGIPKSDLASAIQTSLGKADTALQSFTETDPVFTASAAHDITSDDITNWNNKYTKPSTGIPASDLASGVIPTTLPASDVKSWAKADSKPTYTASEVGALASTTTHLSGDIATSEKGSANGVATLGSDGKVPSSQLPSYVDDVLEYTNKASFPTTGESGKIYVDKATNLTWRWSGSAYVEISPSLALGETSSTAYAGDKGKANADAISALQTTVAGKGTYSKPSTGIPKADLASDIQTSLGKADTALQSVTKSDVGLGNVGNFKAVSTVASQGLTNTEKSNARTNIGAGTSNFSGSYNDLTDKPTAVTESTVSGWGFTKNTGTYSKPSGGIPASDLASGVIPTTLPASDVYSWAKASTKPNYTASEVGALPNTTTIPTKTSQLTNDSNFARISEDTGSYTSGNDILYKSNIVNNLVSSSTTDALAAAQGKALNSRIDNLVVSAGGTSPVEVTDARVGADGTTYTTLKNRLDAEKSSLSESITEISDNVFSKNLLGMNEGELYSVNIKPGTYITMSTSDGSIMPSDSGVQIQFFDENKRKLDYFEFANGENKRTVQIHPSLAMVKYLSWNKKWNVPLQAEVGQDATDYEEYFYNPKDFQKNAYPVIGKINEKITDEKMLEVAKGTLYITDFGNNEWGQSGGTIHIQGKSDYRISFNRLYKAKKGDKVIITNHNGQLFAFSTWSLDGTSLYYGPGWSNNTIDYTFDRDCLFLLNCKKTNDSKFNLDELKIEIVYKCINPIEGLNKMYENEMEATINTVLNIIDEPSIVFPLVTDIHYKSNSVDTFNDTIDTIKYFTEKIACDGIINLGDNIDGSTDKNAVINDTRYMLNRFKEIGIPYYHAIGNHDTNYNGALLTVSEMYSLYLANTHGVIPNASTLGTDYYKDFDNLGVRLVVLNANYENAYKYSTTTIEWLRNALNTQYTVILAEHDSVIKTENFSNQYTAHADNLKPVLDEFKRINGKLIHICGHSHADYSFAEPYLTVFSNCAKFEKSDLNNSGYTVISGYDSMGIVAPDRNANDYTKVSWSVMIVKPISRKVHFVRFGAGSDREYTY